MIDPAEYSVSYNRSSFERSTDPVEVYDAPADEAPKAELGEKLSIVKAFIVSDIAFVREALAKILMDDFNIVIAGASHHVQDLHRLSDTWDIRVILLDAAISEGVAIIRQARTIAPRARVVVFGVVETDATVIAWAEAGIAGYVPRTSGLADLARAVSATLRGEQVCTARVASGLIRRLGERPRAISIEAVEADSTRHTARESEILRMLADGHSNKDIARKLNIAVGTTKSHVHHLLQKLKLARRGQAAGWLSAR